MILRPFTDHPRSVGEGYFEHMGSALRVAGRLWLATTVVFIHAFLPFLFKDTGSRILKKLLAERNDPDRGSGKRTDEHGARPEAERG